MQFVLYADSPLLITIADCKKFKNELIRVSFFYILSCIYIFLYIIIYYERNLYIVLEKYKFKNFYKKTIKNLFVLKFVYF